MQRTQNDHARQGPGSKGRDGTDKGGDGKCGTSFTKFERYRLAFLMDANRC